MQDIRVVIKVMKRYGAKVTVKGLSVKGAPQGFKEAGVPTPLASEIGSSSILIGLLRAPFVKVVLPLPSVCDMGNRNFDCGGFCDREAGMRLLS